MRGRCPTSAGAAALLLLMLTDAAYSGDWSRIGVLSTQQELLLQQVSMPDGVLWHQATAGFCKLSLEPHLLSLLQVAFEPHLLSLLQVAFRLGAAPQNDSCTLCASTVALQVVNLIFFLNVVCAGSAAFLLAQRGQQQWLLPCKALLCGPLALLELLPGKAN